MSNNIVTQGREREKDALRGSSSKTLLEKKCLNPSPFPPRGGKKGRKTERKKNCLYFVGLLL